MKIEGEGTKCIDLTEYTTSSFCHKDFIELGDPILWLVQLEKDHDFFTKSH